MTLGPIQNPFQPIVGLTGIGLNDGNLYIGANGADPQTSPQACFWDAAGTIPATQPIPISGGYPMRLGTPAQVFTALTYSMRVRDRLGVQVFYVASVTPGATTRDGIFENLADAIAAVIPVAVRDVGVTALGYYMAQDGGGASYKYVAAEPAHPGKFQSADGAWWELAELVVTPLMLGAKADGATDDTSAFQDALDVGRPVYVPATTTYYEISSPLTVGTAGQTVYGSGAASRIVQTGINADASVFFTSQPRVEFRDLNVTPGTTVAATVQGYGFAVSGTNRALITGCRVSGMRRGGVLIYNSNNCIVDANIFVDSVVPNDRSVPQSDTGYDVNVLGTSSYNTVSNNQCISGCGMGINVQTGTAGVSQYGNVITGNTIRNQPVYGIEVYLSGTVGADFCNDVVISGNYIENISGAINTGANNFYGAGIYIQSVDNFTVVGNVIKNTNTNRAQPYLGSAVPAAIAVSGLPNGTIDGNTIVDCYWGIASIQATALTAAGRGTIISNNEITGADARGVHLADCVSATVSSNRLQGAGTHGIYLNAVGAGHMDDFIISANRIEGFEVGVETNNSTPIDRMVIADNIVRGHLANGISCSATVAHIHHNQIVSGVAGSNGINLTAATVFGWCSENYIDVVNVGVVNASGGTLSVDRNIVVTAATPFSGNVWNLLDATSATPSVRGGPVFRMAASAVNITGFSDGCPGQEITLRVTGARTLVNGGDLTLQLGVNAALPAESMITFRHNGSRFVETGRMTYV
jgi:parallel beta-helix repeat protein